MGLDEVGPERARDVVGAGAGLWTDEDHADAGVRDGFGAREVGSSVLKGSSDSARYGAPAVVEVERPPWTSSEGRA